VGPNSTALRQMKIHAAEGLKARKPSATHIFTAISNGFTTGPVELTNVVT